MLVGHYLIDGDGLDVVRVLAHSGTAVSTFQSSVPKLFSAWQACNFPAIEDVALAAIDDVPVSFLAFFLSALHTWFTMVILFEWM